MQVWSWEYFWKYAINAYLWGGAVTTVWLTIVALGLGLVLGLIIALMRMAKIGPLNKLALAYAWLFRGTPLLVQLMFIYTGLPILTDLRLTVTQAAILGLMLNEAAYLSEIIRAGIMSVPKGQGEAAWSLGLSRMNSYRTVILPQAVRLIIPPLGNSVNGLLKTTSVASVISMEELMRRNQILQQEHFAVLELFAVISIIYLAMTTGWDMVQRRLEAHFGKAYAERSTQHLQRDDH